MIISTAIEEEDLLLQDMDVEWMVIVAAVVVEEGLIVAFITICLLLILIHTVDHQMHFMVHHVEEEEDKDHLIILPITVVEDFLPVDGGEEEEWTDLFREVHHNVHRTGVR